jgi:hypothetical protein
MLKRPELSVSAEMPSAGISTLALSRIALEAALLTEPVMMPVGAAAWTVARQSTERRKTIDIRK